MDCHPACSGLVSGMYLGSLVTLREMLSGCGRDVDCATILLPPSRGERMPSEMTVELTTLCTNQWSDDLRDFSCLTGQHESPHIFL